ncbi:MAG TPA: HDOD domain-containing protein, partial [Leptospiraceae bacterium]|nr:HDOD domain-containing protein [Leptospiraceae bacterium]
ELPTLTALVSFDLSVPMGLKKIREELFLPASFRDSGKTILALNLTKQYHDVIEVHHKSGISLSDLEMEVFHTTSNEVGLHVFKVWHMPENLYGIIQNQSFGMDQISSVQDIDRLTRLGEIISRKLLSLSVSSGETEMAMSIMQIYKVHEGLIDAFDEDYYDNIRTHPFMEVL